MIPLASIIVPTRGRPSSLARTLETLCAQSAPARDFELIVVENGPASLSRGAVSRAASRHPENRVRYVHEPVSGLLAGRHRGALEARGQFLVFVDDDIDATPGWLASVLEAFGDGGVQIVGGKSLPGFEREPPAWLEAFWWTPPGGGEACIFLSLIDLGETARVVDASLVWGLNFAIRREVFYDLGGFHPDIVDDRLQFLQGDGETGLTLKATAAGLSAFYQPAAEVRHRIPAERLSGRYFRCRAFFEGICNSFSALRGDSKTRTIGESPGPAKRPASRPPRLTPQRRHALSWAKDGLARIGRSLTAAPPLEREESPARLRAECDSARRAGFEFHREAALGNAELLEWVLRRDYLDYRLPDLHPALARELGDQAASARISASGREG